MATEIIKLYVFAGLPGSGKTTLARRLARELEAAYLRIDSIEDALRDGKKWADGPEGYLAAYRIAEDNLGLGLNVVTDSVNPLRITRSAWLDVATRAAVGLVNVEVICSDVAEHRARTEARSNKHAAKSLSWEDVVERKYDPWDAPRLIIDTAGRTESESFVQLMHVLKD